MEQSSPTAPAASGTSSIEAVVIQPSGAYAMYVAAQVTPDGALLSGGLLLEIGEEVLLELHPGNAPVPVIVRTRVLAILPGEQASMQVAFIDVDDATRNRLTVG